jgi:inorganic triphosphatase YgiF
MQEVELKLELSEAAADAVQASGLLPGLPTITPLHAVYYDTPKLALRNAGLSLRIRRTGDLAIQTIKAAGPGTAGLFARSEWEQPVEGEAPELDETNPITMLLGEKTRKLVPSFEVLVERRAWMIRQDDAEIELILDRGRVIAGERDSPVCEIELELRSGAAAALFAAGRELEAATPVRIGVLTKSERGYLLREPEPRAYKAEPVHLAGDATAAQALQAIAQSCLRQFRLNEDLLARTRAAEPLHQARVAIRRLRSAFSIYRPLISVDPRSGELAGELRWLAAQLGEARDLDVLLGRLEASELHDRVQAERAAAYDHLAQLLDTRRVRRLMLEVLAWLHGGEWLRAEATEPLRHQDARAFAAAALDRLRRKMKKAGPALAGPDDEVRHDVRKDAKKLRYAAEFFDTLFDDKAEKRRRKRFQAALQDLQEQLGTLNDMATAPGLLDRLDAAGHPQAQSLEAGEEKDALIRAAVAAHARLVEAKPFWRLQAKAQPAA